mmetsp:Transcript_22662/g.62919  ORF Transcript_22662/g.62919 Transcript_22662/m.62919 type:complete len:313 (-) Transcript_22662:249-1187(-)
MSTLSCRTYHTMEIGFDELSDVADVATSRLLCEPVWCHVGWDQTRITMDYEWWHPACSIPVQSSGGVDSPGDSEDGASGSVSIDEDVRWYLSVSTHLPNPQSAELHCSGRRSSSANSRKKTPSKSSGIKRSAKSGVPAVTWQQVLRTQQSPSPGREPKQPRLETCHSPELPGNGMCSSHGPIMQHSTMPLGPLTPPTNDALTLEGASPSLPNLSANMFLMCPKQCESVTEQPSSGHNAANLVCGAEASVVDGTLRRSMQATLMTAADAPGNQFPKVAPKTECLTNGPVSVSVKELPGGAIKLKFSLDRKLSR